MRNDNIFFEPATTTSSPQGGGPKNKTGIPYATVVTPPSTFKKPIPGNYPNKYEELLDKCDPKHFMSPYDPRKVDIANELYSELLNTDKGNITTLNELRKRAVTELGIKISTVRLYNELLTVCNPKQYTGETYDKELLSLSNLFYPLIPQNADDIFALEDIWRKAQPIYKEYKQRLAAIKKERKLQEKEEQKKALMIWGIFFSVLVFVFVCVYFLFGYHDGMQ